MKNPSSGFKIVVDAMGGDFAPRNIVLGAVDAVRELPDIEVILIGRKTEINRVLSEEKISFKPENIVDAQQVIGMSDSPTAAVKSKKDSSIVKGLNLVKDGKADAFVSAGNTGAVSAASTLILGRIKGIGRPTIMAAFPNQKGTFTYVADVGAFVDSKPQHLFDFALLSSTSVKEIAGIENPSIVLLYVGK